MKLKIAITHGDINGVGYQVILKALEDSHMLELCTPIIYGSAKIAANYRKLLGLPDFKLNIIDSPADARTDAVNIINVIGEDVQAVPGQPTPEAGRAAVAALEHAVADLRNGDVNALVTAPINKKTVQSDTFIFTGHTEYLQSSLGEEGDQALMILFNDRIRVALATTHLPVAQIASSLTREGIADKIRVFARSLHRDFTVDNPRIAVLALNPHSGDGGLLGHEEQEIITPAIEDVRAEKIMAFGPYAADGFFGAGLFSKFDGVLAMYHDQGLAPFKTIAMDEGVNFTAGLPFVRTSPDHGTGYDIATENVASADSMRSAIYAAIDIVRSRANDDIAHRNPLRRQYHDRSNNDATINMTAD